MEVAEAALREHAAGASLRQIGAKHNVSHETARVLVQRAAREHLVEVSGRLLLARRSGEYLPIEVPGSGPGLRQGLLYLAWLIAELKELGISVKAHCWEVEHGLVVGLEELPKEENE